MSYVYLGSPYGDPDPEIMHKRFQVAEWVSYNIMAKQGVTVYSPIVCWHETANIWKMSLDWKFWREHSQNMLRDAKELLILPVEKWQRSKGLAEERTWATNWEKPIKFVHIGDKSVDIVDDIKFVRNYPLDHCMELIDAALDHLES
jgi:hypothetical protein